MSATRPCTKDVLAGTAETKSNVKKLQGTLYFQTLEDRGQLGNQLFQIAGMAIAAHRLNMQYQMLLPTAKEYWSYQDCFVFKLPTLKQKDQKQGYVVPTEGPHDDAFASATYRDGDVLQNYFQCAAPFFESTAQTLLSSLFQPTPNM